MFIDTHTHLFASQFDEDREDSVNRSIEAGIKLMMLPNINFETIDQMMALHKKFPKNCLPMLGLHPCDVKSNYKDDLNLMKPMFQSHKFYGVGETGIDLHWDKTTLHDQMEALKIQISWAKEFKLPIIIHARESYEELFEVFDELNDDSLTGIFHCFTGSKEEADHIIGYEGFKLGIGGVLTFKNSGLDKTIKDISLDHLVLETDSPYLAPHPNRGKRNESSFLIYIASKLAEVKGMRIEEVMEKTTENACEIFKINFNEHF